MINVFKYSEIVCRMTYPQTRIWIPSLIFQSLTLAPKYLCLKRKQSIQYKSNISNFVKYLGQWLLTPLARIGLRNLKKKIIFIEKRLCHLQWVPFRQTCTTDGVGDFNFWYCKFSIFWISLGLAHMIYRFINSFVLLDYSHVKD